MMKRLSVRSLRGQMPLPIWVRYGWLKRKLRAHPVWDREEFTRCYRWLMDTQWWSHAQLEAYQNEQLRALVEHAYDNVPYYRQIFEERRIKPTDISTIADLQKLPILTKDDIQKHAQEMVARNEDLSKLRFITTSGTTGKPLGLYQDRDTADSHEEAFIRRQWSWAGYRIGDPYVTLRGNPIQRIDRNGKRRWWDYDSGSNELLLSSMDFSEERLNDYVALMQKFAPKFINAYPSSLEILSRFMQRHGLNGIRPKAIFCESETVYPWQRELSEKVFGCPIFAGYGHTERAVDAVECEAHDGYHDCMEYGILELLDPEDQPIDQPKITGKVVATGFDTYSMPLIRYATDDLASYADHSCNCGRELTLINDFEGRVQEYVVTRSGSLIPFWALPEHMPFLSKILALRFLQDRAGELVIEVTKVPDASEAELREQFQNDFTDLLDAGELSVSIIFTDQIPHTQRGKLGYFEQKLSIQMRDIPRLNHLGGS